MDYLIQCTVTIETKEGDEVTRLESPKIVAKDVQTPPEDIAGAVKDAETEQVLFDMACDLEKELTEPTSKGPNLSLVS